MNSILIVTTIPETLSAFLLPFAHHLRSLGWRVDGMACGITANIECVKAFNCVWDVEWSRHPLEPQNLLMAPKIIREVVAWGQYDIVHVHTPVAAFVTRYALKDRRQKKPQVIYTAHGFHFYRGGKLLKNTAFLALEKLAGGWTNYLVTLNKEDEEAAQRYQLVPPDRIRYMPGIGVNLSEYSRDAISDADVHRVRQELGLNADMPMLLCVAEFIGRKRHADVLKALARLGRSHVCLAFAGTGPLLKQMQRLAFSLGVQHQVRFLGFRRDIPALMRTATATILVSSQEGLPRSVMESLGLQTPVIGTEIRGTQELLAGGCGLLVKVGDVEGLTAAIAWLLDHPEAAQIMGQRGLERMAEFDLQNVLRLHESLYAEALGTEAVSPANVAI